MANAFSELFGSNIDVESPGDYNWTKNGELKQKFIDAILKCNGNIDKLTNMLYGNENKKAKKKQKFIKDEKYDSVKIKENLEKMQEKLKEQPPSLEDKENDRIK